jgi:hypothetical protein
MLYGENEKRWGQASAFVDQLDLVLFRPFRFVLEIYLHCLNICHVVKEKLAIPFH